MEARALAQRACQIWSELLLLSCIYCRPHLSILMSIAKKKELEIKALHCSSSTCEKEAYRSLRKMPRWRIDIERVFSPSLNFYQT
mmetsp:Transcript_3714/g.9452  ORF Transcript_3714/g.9452 Transcript_3714/m.9452 type:complete len:85 (-) Transcript_3714:522-776(-)